MPMWLQKKLWWAMLLVSGGGALTLLVLSIAVGEVAPPVWWIWPPLALSSGLMLRRCYLIEPSTDRGYWHLRLEDLLCAGLYAGLLLAILKASLGSYFLTIGITFAFINAGGLVLGFLAAQKRGIAARSTKLALAFAYGTRAVGLLAAGALFAVVIMDWLQFNAPWNWMKNIFLGSGYAMREDAPWLLLHRMSLACLPVGMLLYLVVSLLIRRRQPAPAGAQAPGIKVYLAK